MSITYKRDKDTFYKTVDNFNIALDIFDKHINISTKCKRNINLYIEILVILADPQPFQEAWEIYPKYYRIYKKYMKCIKKTFNNLSMYIDTLEYEAGVCNISSEELLEEYKNIKKELSIFKIDISNKIRILKRDIKYNRILELIRKHIELKNYLEAINIFINQIENDFDKIYFCKDFLVYKDLFDKTNTDIGKQLSIKYEDIACRERPTILLDYLSFFNKQQKYQKTIDVYLKYVDIYKASGYSLKLLLPYYHFALHALNRSNYYR